jgi:hypothetical protein
MQSCGGMEHIESIANKLNSKRVSKKNLEKFCKKYLADLEPKTLYSLDFDVSDMCRYYKLPNGYNYSSNNRGQILGVYYSDDGFDNNETDSEFVSKAIRLMNNDYKPKSIHVDEFVSKVSQIIKGLEEKEREFTEHF